MSTENCGGKIRLVAGPDGTRLSLVLKIDYVMAFDVLDMYEMGRDIDVKFLLLFKFGSHSEMRG